MINAVEFIEGTPMACSIDDFGIIKLWDIRNLTCIQTIECGRKVKVTKISSAYLKGAICLFGARVSVIEFAENNEIVKKVNNLMKNILNYQ